MANKPKIKKKACMVKKKVGRGGGGGGGGGGGREKTTTLSENKEEASNVSEQRDKGWIHVINIHEATHLTLTTIRQGTDAHELLHTKKERAVSLNIETTPLTRTSQMNDITRETKGHAKRKKQ